MMMMVSSYFIVMMMMMMMMDIVVSFVYNANNNIHLSRQWYNGRISKMIVSSNHLNNQVHDDDDDDDMKLSYLLKELIQKGVRFPPNATIQ